IDCLEHHGYKYEVAVLANFITQRAGLICITVTYKASEVLAVLAVNPVFFKRVSIVEHGTIVCEPDGIRSEQPLVARAYQSVGLDYLYVEWESSYGLCSVNDEQCVYRPGFCAYCFQVKTCSICPVKMRNCNSSSLFVYFFQDSFVPAFTPVGVCIRRTDYFNFGAAFFAKPFPAIVVAWELFSSDKDVLSAFNVHVCCNGCHTV